MAAGSDELKIGAEVEATDGSCGHLIGMVVEPIADKLTHVIVKPHRHQGFGRLVEIDLVQSGGDPIKLSCTIEQFLARDEAEEIQFLPPTDTGGNVYAWPHYDVGLVGGMGAGSMGDVGLAHHATPQPFATERVPLGEVEVCRGDPVHATDGTIGEVKGLAVDPADHHVTHVLLKEGHFWGHKQVAIPIGATARIDDEIHVKLTKEQIEQLPSVGSSG
jgi:hypothetical protein